MADENAKIATFAGGCFWCMEPPFDKLPGVITTTPGYTGGHTEKPTYEQVCSGDTGHAEAVQIVFNPGKVSYRELLDVFWRNIDPTTRDRQFADSGSQYRTAIFYHDEEQRRLAEESKVELEKSGIYPGSIVTEIVPARPFYVAEAYHCQYYKKNPVHYRMYRQGSGRESYLEKTWGTRKVKG